MWQRWSLANRGEWLESADRPEELEGKSDPGLTEGSMLEAERDESLLQRYRSKLDPRTIAVLAVERLQQEADMYALERAPNPAREKKRLRRTR